MLTEHITQWAIWTPGWVSTAVRFAQPMKRGLVLLAVLPGVLAPVAARATDYDVRSSGELVRTAPQLQAGDRLLLHAGTYSGNIRLRNLHGRPDAPIVIKGIDGETPPIFQDTREAIHLSESRYVLLDNLRLSGITDRGITVADTGGEADTHHIELRRIDILGISPRGDHDPLHLLNVSDVIVRESSFKGWGGNGIDIIGCRSVWIDECLFNGFEKSDQETAISVRGGSSNIVIQSCTFLWSGKTVVHIGGETEASHFWQADAAFEAADVTVAGNRFFGGVVPIAWDSARDTAVHHNAILLPHFQVLNIRRTSRNPQLLVNGDLVFADNVVVYDARVRRHITMNIDISPDVLALRGNAWFAMGNNRPLRLPVPETDQVQDIDPEVSFAGANAYRVQSTNAVFATRGPDAYTPVPPPFML